MATRKTPQVADIFAASKAARANRRPEPVPEPVEEVAEKAAAAPAVAEVAPSEAVPSEAVPSETPHRAEATPKRRPKQTSRPAPKPSPKPAAEASPKKASPKPAPKSSESPAPASRGRTRMGAWKDPSRQKTTILVDKQLMLRVKIRALEEERELWQIVEGLLEAYIDDRLDFSELDLDREVDF